jgi:hypothetical protein
MRAAKQIVFRYNGDPTTEESDLDMAGDKSVDLDYLPAPSSAFNKGAFGG